MKSVRIRSFFWSVFSCIQTEYGYLRSKSPYSVRMQENADQKNLRMWTLFMQCEFLEESEILQFVSFNYWHYRMESRWSIFVIHCQQHNCIQKTREYEHVCQARLFIHSITKEQSRENSSSILCTFLFSLAFQSSFEKLIA